MDHKKITRVLGLKEMKKDRLELEVKVVRDALDNENKKLDSLKDTFDSIVRDFNARHKNGYLNANEIEFFHDYFSHLNRQISSQEQNVIKKAEELKEKEDSMFEAYREKRLFEIFRDRVMYEEIKESLLKEQKENDFNFISRMTRR